MNDSHPSHPAGKGSQPRPYNPAAYAANYDAIFRKNKTTRTLCCNAEPIVAGEEWGTKWHECPVCGQPANP